MRKKGFKFKLNLSSVNKYIIKNIKIRRFSIFIKKTHINTYFFFSQGVKKKHA